MNLFGKYNFRSLHDYGNCPCVCHVCCVKNKTHKIVRLRRKYAFTNKIFKITLVSIYLTIYDTHSSEDNFSVFKLRTNISINKIRFVMVINMYCMIFTFVFVCFFCFKKMYFTRKPISCERTLNFFLKTCPTHNLNKCQ